MASVFNHSHRLTLCLATVTSTWFVSSAQAQVAAAGDEAASPVLALSGWIEKYDEVAKAKDSFVGNNVSEALERLKAAAASHPELPAGELLLAELWFAARNQAAAIAALDKAVEQYPEDPEPYLMLGNLAFMQNRNTDARLLFAEGQRMLRSYQGNAESRRRMGIRLYAGLASLQERQKEWKNAIPHLQAWVKLDPENATARIRLARSLFRAKKGKEAYAEAQQAVALNSDLPPATIIVAQLYTENNELEMARKWLAAAEKSDANNLTARLAMANWYWQQGEAKGAKRHAQAAYKIDPKSPKSAMIAGMVAQFEQDYAAAEKHFEAAQRAAPDDFGARNHLAMVLAAQDDPSKTARAAKLAETNLRDNPSNPLAAATYGWVQMELGQKTQAERSLQAAANTRRTTPDMLYIFAKYWADNGQNEQAVKALEQLLKMKPLFVFRGDAQQLYDQLK